MRHALAMQVAEDSGETYYVVRVNLDPRDTHFGRSLMDAVFLAAPGLRCVVQVGKVTASSVGEACQKVPARWFRVR